MHAGGGQGRVYQASKGEGFDNMEGIEYRYSTLLYVKLSVPVGIVCDGRLLRR